MKLSSVDSRVRGEYQSKGSQMSPLLVLLSTCFRSNVNVTCKIMSLLCSLDNFLLKNAIVFFFGNQISKWHSFDKRAIFDILFTFFSHQGKDTKIPSAHPTFIHSHILVTLLIFFFFLAFPTFVYVQCMDPLWCDSWC